MNGLQFNSAQKNRKELRENIIHKHLHLTYDSQYPFSKLTALLSAIQKLIQEHEGVIAHEWLGFSHQHDKELSIWSIQLKEHLQYNFFLELQLLTETPHVHWKCVDTLSDLEYAQ